MGNLPHHCCGRVTTICPKMSSLESDIFDDPTSCDPAGAIFRETLEDLNEVDRLLLLFCSSCNLAAVRWLFVLGASPDACDTNGTTCLHAACRSGSIAIVRDLMARGLPLDAADVTGWTALHIAAFMGRRAVAVELMQSGIDLSRKNLKGMGPADLCSDGWLREAIYSCGRHCQIHGKAGGSTWKIGVEHDVDLVEDIQVSSRLRFEPFFVPRKAVLRDPARMDGLRQLGIEIFNRTPGQGLAFLVASGAVRDFPIELSTFLLENSVSPVQVGEFLGEDFSLSQTLRLEFINSVRLTGTGVVACLAKVFSRVHIPSDMQKIDRLLESVAQIWWRQHERLQERSLNGDLEGDGTEIEGLQLMKHLANYGVLAQMMFSSVLLHWSLYAPLPPSQRITLQQWLDMNVGLGGPDDSASRSSIKDTAGSQSARGSTKQRQLQHMQCLIYNAINRAFLPQLQIWSAPNPSSSGKLPSSLASSWATMKPVTWQEQEPVEREFSEREAPKNEPGKKKDEEVLESWACLVGGGFPSSGSMGYGMGSTMTYRHVRSIHSETTSSTFRMATPSNSRPNVMDGPAPPTISREVTRGVTFPGSRAAAADIAPTFGASGDRVWLSLKQAMLFFSAKPQHWAPYAFVPLSHVSLRVVDPQTCSFTLEGRPVATPQQAARTGDIDILGKARAQSKPPGGTAAEAPEENVQIVFLLPDGRWQTIEVTQLEVQVMDNSQLDKWVNGLSSYCRGDRLNGPVPIDTSSTV